MRQFEKCNKYKDNENIVLPVRATSGSAGYDFYAAEDTVIPSFFKRLKLCWKFKDIELNKQHSPAKFVTVLNKISLLLEPTIIPTGVKAKMEKDEVLLLFGRSSSSIKKKLLMANGVGVIDSDYYDTDNEIGFPLWNLSPFKYVVKRGEKIGQGVFTKFLKVDNDNIKATRTGGYGSTDEQN